MLFAVMAGISHSSELKNTVLAVYQSLRTFHVMVISNLVPAVKLNITR
jgi:hypothetical protein